MFGASTGVFGLHLTLMSYQTLRSESSPYQNLSSLLLHYTILRRRPQKPCKYMTTQVYIFGTSPRRPRAHPLMPSHITISIASLLYVTATLRLRDTHSKIGNFPPYFFSGSSLHPRPFSPPLSDPSLASYPFSEFTYTKQSVSTTFRPDPDLRRKGNRFPVILVSLGPQLEVKGGRPGWNGDVVFSEM